MRGLPQRGALSQPGSGEIHTGDRHLALRFVLRGTSNDPRIVYSCCFSTSDFTKSFSAPLLFLNHPQPCSRQSMEQFQSHSQCRRPSLKEGVFEMLSFPEDENFHKEFSLVKWREFHT